MVTVRKLPLAVVVNHHNGRSNGKKEEVKSFNAYLADLQNKVFKAHLQLTEKDDPITVERLRDQFQGKNKKAMHLNGYGIFNKITSYYY